MRFRLLFTFWMVTLFYWFGIFVIKMMSVIDPAVKEGMKMALVNNMLFYLSCGLGILTVILVGCHFFAKEIK